MIGTSPPTCSRKETNGVEVVAHTWASRRVGSLERCQVVGVCQERCPAQRQVIIGEVDYGAKVVALAIGVGDSLGDVDLKFLDHAQVGGDENAMVETGVQPAADASRRKGHENVEIWRTVNSFTGEAAFHACIGVHAALHSLFILALGRRD